MELQIRGRRALVTAASRGIGRAIVRTLAAEGARIVTCARSAADLAALTAEIGGEAAGHCGLVLDLTAPGAAAELVKATRAHFGDPEIVVHNFGGTLGIQSPYATADEFAAVWHANLGVSIEVNNAFVPSMVEAKRGRVVSISSNGAIEHQASLAYSTAKAALCAYTRILGRTVAKDDVIVSAVMPGVVLTEGGQWEEAGKRDPEYVARFIKERLPRGAFGTPEEVADFVAFLCSDRATACAGGLFQIDGGQGRSFFG